jgi:hypothetical protein
LEYTSDTGSISNLTWKCKRQGTGTDTTYVLLPTAPDAEPFDWSPYVLYNLENVVRKVPYAEQEGFYLGFEGGMPASSSASTTNINW